MTSNRYFYTVAMISCICGALFVAGCKSNKGNKNGNDVLSPDGVGNDIPLDPREDWGKDQSRRVSVKFQNVHFRYNSFQVLRVEEGKIEEVADYMRRYPRMRLVIEGHCDERGSKEYNMSLGESRALALRSQLVRLGINGSHIQTRSYGEEDPLDPGHNNRAWGLNRRGEFVLYR